MSSAAPAESRGGARSAEATAQPQDRVLELLRKLEGDAEQLSKERDTLTAECARWTPQIGKTSPASGVAPKPPPRRCQDLFDKAAAHERRAAAASRDVQAAKRDVQTSRLKKIEAEKAAAQGLEAAEARRLRAVRRLEELRAERKKAETEHKKWMVDQEAEHEEEVAEIQRKIEAVRAASDETARSHRRQVAQEKERSVREIALAQEDFQRRCADLESELKQHAWACQTAIGAASKRREDAEEAAVSARRKCLEWTESLHKEADEQVENYERERDEHLADMNKMLADHAVALNLELSESAARELALRNDHSAETRAEVACAAINDEVQRRKDDSEDYCRRKWCEAQGLLAEATQAGKRAAARAKEVQEKADEEVEAILKEVSCTGDYEDRILELQARLNAAVREARQGFANRLEHFRAEAARQASEAGTTFLAADQKVEEVRTQAKAETEQRLQAAEQNIRSLHEERQQVAAQAEERLRHAREQMVKYVGSQQHEMLDILSAPDAAEMPFSVSLASLTLPVSPEPSSPNPAPQAAAAGSSGG